MTDFTDNEDNAGNAVAAEEAGMAENAATTENEETVEILDSTPFAARDTDLTKKTYPLRGVLWGIMFGLGLTFLLVTFSIIRLDLVQMLVTLIVGIVLATTWSIFGPAKKPKN